MKYIIVFILSCLTLASHAVQAECSPMTIPELLNIALENNPDTRIAWWNAQRSAAALGIAASDYYPNIRGKASFYHGRDYKFPNGQETNYTTVDGDILLRYLLYDFGERYANNEAAKAALWAANWQNDWTLQKVMHSVLTHAYAYLNARQILFAREASLRESLQTADASSELNRAGLRAITDVYASRTAVADLQMSIVLQKAEVEITKAKLAAAMGLSPDTDLEIVELIDPPEDEQTEVGIACLIDLAKQQRADLMAKWAELERRSALEDKASSKYMPKFFFNADTGYRRYFHDSSNGFHYKVGVGMETSLFNGFEDMYERRQAHAETEMSEAELDKLELEIALDVLSSSRHFQAAQELLHLAQEYLQYALDTFQGVTDRYTAGTQTIFDLTQSQRQLTEARIKHGEAKTRWYRSLAQLAYATGSIADYREVPCAE